VPVGIRFDLDAEGQFNDDSTDDVTSDVVGRRAILRSRR
jgi:hypothetical protein